MKTNLFAILLALLGGSLLVHSEEPLPQPNTARVLGDIPDGTPPPPEPPKPAFIVPARDILETRTHQQGGRTITVQQIKPIVLPPPAKPVPPPDPSAPAVAERIAEIQSAHRHRQELLLVGASVFHAKDAATVRSLVTLSPLGGGQTVTFWSSADFGLLSGFASFVGSDGETRSLMMAWGREEIDSMGDFIQQRGRDYGLSEIPALPAGKATFAILSEKPDVATLASIQSLHDLYNNEHDRLKTAYEGREQARLQHEAELKANPPKPKNITLSYWRTEKPAPANGGAR